MFLLLSFASALIPIPKGGPGILLGSPSAQIKLEVVVDATCPDCGAIWPNIEKVLDTYDSVSVQVQWLCLPSHTWSYVVTRAVFAIHSLVPEKAKLAMHALFTEHGQDQFSSYALAEVGEAVVTEKVLTYFEQAVSVPPSQMENAFNSVDVQMAARISYKYSFIQDVPGTPTVFANGDQTKLTEDSSWLDWQEFIDQLLK